DASAVENWTEFTGTDAEAGNGAPPGINVLMVGAASAVMFSLIAQIGEQVDFLRFLPAPTATTKVRWWCALIAGGPGWIVIGVIKILAGSFLVVLALNHGVAYEEAADPTHMYMVAFSYVVDSPQVSLAVAGIFVILCQL